MKKSIFAKGPAVVMDSVRENVEWFFGDMEGQGIGSSDITVCLKAICGDVCNDANLDNYSDSELHLVKNAIHNALYDLEY